FFSLPSSESFAALSSDWSLRSSFLSSFLSFSPPSCSDSSSSHLLGAPPSPLLPRTWPSVPVSPPSALISLSTPSAGAGTSSTTLSVSRSTRFSSRSIASPGFLCHLAMVASETDSGRLGTLTSTLMGRLLREFAWGQRLADQALLLFDMDLVIADGRRRRALAANVAKLLIVADTGLNMMANLEPSALV